MNVEEYPYKRPDAEGIHVRVRAVLLSTTEARLMDPSATQPEPIALTGATGYVGGRLGAHLLQAGYPVRCLVRSALKLQARGWSATTRVNWRVSMS